MNSDLILGIDEAGLGSVFGPLVVSGVVIEKKNITLLKLLAVKDSKKFRGNAAHQKRKNVWESCKQYIITEKRVVIDSKSLDKNNMYELHINACIQILMNLKHNNMEQIYIDQLGALKQQKFASKLGFWHNKFIYEKKSDIKYKVVSLASIGAKILRDDLVMKLCKNADENYVSGYANNVTEDFFQRYFKRNGCLPPGTRISRKWFPITEKL